MRTFLIAALLLASCTCFAQKTDSLPYQRYRDLPAFEVMSLTGDSTFNTYNIPKGKVAVLVLFSPDCDHCEQQMRQVVGQMGNLRQVNFYLMTPMDLDAARKFSDRLGLSEFGNVHVYGDHQFFYHKYYGVRFVPDFAIYDKNRKFVRLEEGKLDIPALIQLSKS